MTVKKESLLLIVGIVWFVAGINVVLVGLGSMFDFDGLKLAAILLGAIVVFTLFHVRRLPHRRWRIWPSLLRRHDAAWLQQPFLE